MQVNLLKLYQANGRTFAPGVYDITQLPPYIHNKSEYVQVIEEGAEKEVKEIKIEKKKRADIDKYIIRDVKKEEEEVNESVS